jgi:short-subunit dehydrogenase
MNVVVVGASSGIGRALAETFAREGHNVLAVARRGQRLQALCQEIAEQCDASAHYLAIDVTSENAPQIVLDEAIRALGKVHVLIYAAAMSPYQKFQELAQDHIRQIITLNVQSLTDFCHLFMAHMLAHGEPSHVVNVGSVGGYAPLPNFSVYSGSKHFVRVFTNLLRHEYRRSNIRVTGLHPGGTLTEFLELAGERVTKFAQRTMMTPDQVAEKAYPAILRGKRVIIPGIIDKLAVLVGKFLPFPVAIRVTELIYHLNVEKVDPTYPP